MAVILVEGFDAYNGVSTATAGSLASGWYNISAAAMTTGRFGGQAVRLTGIGNNTPNARRRLTSNITQGCIGVAVRPTTMSTSGFINLGVFDSSSTGLAVRFNSDGSLAVGTTNDQYSMNVTFSTTAAGLLTLNNWSYIELEFTVSNTTGSFTLYVNGASVASGTNLDTLITSSSYSLVALGFQIPSLNGGIFDYDDLYITDTNTRLGEQRIETLYPSADTAQKQWTPSTGSNNYGTVDETIMNTTDFVSTNVLNNLDLYDFTNLSSTPNAISAVAVSALAQKDNVGTRAIAMPVKSGSTTSDGANNYLAGGYILSNRILETDPNTAGAWTSSAVNALQAGVKVTI